MTFAERRALVASYLGKMVTITVDRPVGYRHRNANGVLTYPINYGYVPGVNGGDGEPLDVYLLGVDEPVNEYTGVIIGAAYRADDAEDKLLMAPAGVTVTHDEAAAAIRFQEQYYCTEVHTVFDETTYVRPAALKNVTVTGGFWRRRLDNLEDVMLGAVYDRFQETHRFDALRCEWKDGDPDCPHFFWDSDVAKWMESAAYVLLDRPSPDLEKKVDDAVADIVANMTEDGYFNSHFLVCPDPPRFTERDLHELYCLGHLLEAGIAYYEATGKDALLNAMRRYVALARRVFMTEQSAPYATPGHPELELALCRLYRLTGDEDALAFAKFLLDIHGDNDKDKSPYDPTNGLYNQDEMPLRERSTVDGHSVRALYLLTGAADAAAATGDGDMAAACERCFDTVTRKRMYVTGGVGSTSDGEAFTYDYDLPNDTAYAESCASISLAYFAERMERMTPDARYGDIVERTMYNGILSGVSLDGTTFFYENPLEIDLTARKAYKALHKKRRFPPASRSAVFSCSCCPPNITRFIGSIGAYAYGIDDNALYVHQYLASEMNEGDDLLRVETDYPITGTVRVDYRTDKPYVALRIPGWCRSFTLSAPYELRRGYAYIRASGEGSVTLELEMQPVFVQADPRVRDDAGRVAVMRGPVVYCAEGVDNPVNLKSLVLDTRAGFEECASETGVPALQTSAVIPACEGALYRPLGGGEESLPVRLIPYFAFANRGETDLQVWFLYR